MHVIFCSKEDNVSNNYEDRKVKFVRKIVWLCVFSMALLGYIVAKQH